MALLIGPSCNSALHERYAYPKEVELRCVEIEEAATDAARVKGAENAGQHIVRQQANILLEIASRPATTPKELGHKASIIAAAMQDLWWSEDDEK